MEFSHIDFSLMETEDLEILLKISDIDIKLDELEEKQRKANQKRRRRMRVQWTRDWIMRRTLFGQYENLLMVELNREDPKRYKNFLRVDNDLFEHLLQKVSPYITKKTTKLEASYCPVNITCNLCCLLYLLYFIVIHVYYKKHKFLEMLMFSGSHWNQA